MKFGIGVLFLLALYGCGGSEGDSPPPTPTPVSQPPLDPNLTVPVRLAVAHIVNDGLNQPFTISGWIDNSTAVNPIPVTPITGNGQFYLGVASPATKFGFSILQASEVVTGVLIANGVSAPFANTATVGYRLDNTLVSTEVPGELILYTPFPYPETVRAGDTGSVGNGTEFNADGSPVTFCPATVARSYTVASDGVDSLLATVITDEANTCLSGSGTQTQTVYRIDTAGNIRLVSITAVKSSLGSVFQTLIFTF